VRGGAAKASTDGDWDDFLKDKAAYWREHLDQVPSSHRPITLLEYLGMTGDEYADWFTTGHVADRVKRVWSPAEMRYLYR